MHRQVEAVFEYRDGFLWIGTSGGLQRYDGYEFKNWTKANTGGLIGAVYRIGQDADGLIWVNADVYLNPVTGEITGAAEKFGPGFPVLRTDGEHGWSPAFQESYHRGQDGRFVFFMNRPNRIVRITGPKAYEIVAVPGLPDAFSELYFIDDEDCLWITSGLTDATLFRVSPRGEILSRYDFADNYNIRDFSQSGDTIQFRVTYANKKQVQKRVDLIQLEFGREPFRVRSSIENFDRSHPVAEGIWGLYEDTIKLVDHQSGQAVYNHPTGAGEWLRGALCIYPDSRGDYWVGNWKGLTRVRVRESKFRRFFSFEFGDRNRPFLNATRGLTVYDDTLLICAEFGALVRVPLATPDAYEVLQWEGDILKEAYRPLLLTKVNEACSWFNDSRSSGCS